MNAIEPSAVGTDTLSAPINRSAAALLTWTWRDVDHIASPQAVVAVGPVVQDLLARCQRLPSSRRERLTLVAADDWLVLMGEADDLPWADGVRYAAPDPQAPALWRPTHRTPDLPPDLIARALQHRHGDGPLLLWPDPACVLPLAAATPVSDAALATLARRWCPRTGRIA
jgi:MoxR-vWA-beta-propeller ternary system domain bpX5